MLGLGDGVDWGRHRNGPQKSWKMLANGDGNFSALGTIFRLRIGPAGVPVIGLVSAPHV